MWSQEPFWPIDTAYYVRLKGETDLRWVYWCLSNLPLNRLGSSTGVPGLNRNDAYRIRVQVPSLPEQHRIAEILDTADAAIQQIEALIAKPRQMKAGLLHDLLTRGLDEHGQLRDPVAHPEQFKGSVLGRIPREWEVSRLVSRASVFGGKRLPLGHSYSEAPTHFRYLRVLDFFEIESDFQSLEYLKPETFKALERYEIYEGNLFISIAGSLGYAGVFRPSDTKRTILTENAARIVVLDNTVPEFMALQINSSVIQRQIGAEKGTGGGVPNLALFRVENLLLAFPTTDEQKRIVNILDAHDTRIRAEEAYRDKLKQVKKGLMADLLTGRVRVMA